MEEAKKAEEAARRKIQDVENQIDDLKKNLVILKEDLQLRTESRQKYQEEAFEKAYGHSAQKIRDDYVKLVKACCYQGGEGYTVHVPDTNPRGAHHWVLRPDKRAVCEPTPLVHEAFAIIGVEVSIAAEPHVEKWGN